MKINWNVRLKSFKFWLAIVPVFLLVSSSVAQIFGYNFDTTKVATEVTGLITTIFSVLAALGIVVDPTTNGISDSDQALTYTKKSEKTLLKEQIANLSATCAQLSQDATKKTDHDEDGDVDDK